MDQEILQYLHASLRISWFKAWLERSCSLRIHSLHSQPKFRMMQLSEPPPPNSPSEAGNQIPFYFMDVYSSLDRSWHVWEREREWERQTDELTEWVSECECWLSSWNSQLPMLDWALGLSFVKEPRAARVLREIRRRDREKKGTW